MSSSPEVCSSADAVRCLYLARVAERAGRHRAAQRWYAKASQWLDKNLPSSPAVLTQGGPDGFAEEPLGQVVT